MHNKSSQSHHFHQNNVLNGSSEAHHAQAIFPPSANKAALSYYVEPAVHNVNADHVHSEAHSQHSLHPTQSQFKPDCESMHPAVPSSHAASNNNPDQIHGKHANTCSTSEHYRRMPEIHTLKHYGSHGYCDNPSSHHHDVNPLEHMPSNTLYNSSLKYNKYWDYAKSHFRGVNTLDTNDAEFAFTKEVQMDNLSSPNTNSECSINNIESDYKGTVFPHGLPHKPMPVDSEDVHHTSHANYLYPHHSHRNIHRDTIFCIFSYYISDHISMSFDPRHKKKYSLRSLGCQQQYAVFKSDIRQLSSTLRTYIR